MFSTMALIPAHNEGQSLGQAVATLYAQDGRHRHSTYGTVGVARECGLVPVQDVYTVAVDTWVAWAVRELRVERAGACGAVVK